MSRRCSQARAVSLLLALLLALTGCSPRQDSSTAASLNGVDSVVVRLKQISGTFLLQAGSSPTQFTLTTGFPVEQRQITRVDRSALVEVVGREDRPGANSSLTVPAGMEARVFLGPVRSPVDLHIDRVQVTSLDVQQIAAPLTIRATAPVEWVALNMGNAPVTLALPKGTQVHVEGELTADQTAQLAAAGLVQKGAVWESAGQLAVDKPVTRILVGGWTGKLDLRNDAQ